MPLVEFYASPATVDLCGCTRIYWSVEGVRELYFEGNGVVGVSSELVCPSGAGTTTYELRVVHRDGSAQTFTTSVTGGSQPSTSLLDSVRDMLGSECLTYGQSTDCPDEVHIWYPDYDPYRCVGQQAFPQIVESVTNYTLPLTQQVQASDLSTILATRLAAGDVPAYLVLVYPRTVIDGLDYLFEDWPYGQYLYRWDQPSDTVVLLQYRTFDYAPVAEILSPDNGDDFPVSVWNPPAEAYAWVTFSGRTEDTEDADSALTVEWFSDVAGFLGTGSRVGGSEWQITTRLDVEPVCETTKYHTITLRVTDSAGNVSEDTIQVRVWTGPC